MKDVTIIIPGETVQQLLDALRLSTAPHPVAGTPPTGTVVINAGATYTRSRAVTLTLAATDASGVADLCIGEPCGAYVAYATTVATTLPIGAEGTRTVAVRFRDRFGNVANPVMRTPAAGSRTRRCGRYDSAGYRPA